MSNKYKIKKSLCLLFLIIFLVWLNGCKCEEAASFLFDTENRPDQEAAFCHGASDEIVKGFSNFAYNNRYWESCLGEQEGKLYSECIRVEVINDYIGMLIQLGSPEVQFVNKKLKEKHPDFYRSLVFDLLTQSDWQIAYAKGLIFALEKDARAKVR